MIIIKYLNFINESAEESKIGIKSLVKRIQEMNKKNKESISGTTTSTGTTTTTGTTDTTDELLTGITYSYKNDSGATFNVIINSMDDKIYYCKIEGGGDLKINKSHKEQFTKVDKPTEPTKMKIIIGYVYECTDKDGKNNYLITSESADNVGKEYNGVNINKIKNTSAGKIPIENIKIDKKSFTDFVGDNIGNLDVVRLDYYKRLINTYKSLDAGKNWSGAEEMIKEINKRIGTLSSKPQDKKSVQGESKKSVKGEQKQGVQTSVQGEQTPQDQTVPGKVQNRATGTAARSTKKGLG